jgi:hypothetical protein
LLLGEFEYLLLALFWDSARVLPFLGKLHSQEVFVTRLESWSLFAAAPAIHGGINLRVRLLESTGVALTPDRAKIKVITVFILDLIHGKPQDILDIISGIKLCLGWFA